MQPLTAHNSAYNRRFALTAALYVASTAAFYLEKPLEPKVFVLPFIFAFVLTAYLNFERMFFGKPQAPNLYLPFAQLAPLTLLIGKATPPSDCWLIKLVTTPLKWIGLDLIATGVEQWPIVVLLFFLLFFLTFELTRGLALIVSVICLAVSALINGFSMAFAAGSAFLALGYVLHYSPHSGRQIFKENALERIYLSDGPNINGNLLELVVWAAEWLYDEQKLYGNELASKIISKYQSGSESEIKSIESTVARKMVYEYKIAKVGKDDNGEYLMPNKALYYCENNLRLISVVPRLFIVWAVIAVVYCFLPIDLIPDFLPVVGCVDDVLISLVCALPMLKEIFSKRKIPSKT